MLPEHVDDFGERRQKVSGLRISLGDFDQDLLAACRVFQVEIMNMVQMTDKMLPAHGVRPAILKHSQSGQKCQRFRVERIHFERFGQQFFSRVEFAKIELRLSQRLKRARCLRCDRQGTLGFGFDFIPVVITDGGFSQFDMNIHRVGVDHQCRLEFRSSLRLIVLFQQ